MTGKSIAILQSNYIPWKGYFDIIAAVDEFVLFDEAQFTRRDWRNRNVILLDGARHWLTIPVKSKGRFETAIEEIDVADGSWAEKHWRTLQHAYARAPHFETCAAQIQRAYKTAADLVKLSEINELFLRVVADLLEIGTPISRAAASPNAAPSPTMRLVQICEAHGASAYLSGPAAKAYIEETDFRDRGIALSYADYSGYADYDQGAGACDHAVSILDLLFRCGPQARGHLKAVSSRESFVRAA